MAETATERPACVHCGVDVRDGTSFCYNCGKSVEIPISKPDEQLHVSNGSAPVSDEARVALDDLERRFKAEDVADENRLAQAAAERKRARVRSARRNEVVWDAAEPGVSVAFVVFTLIIVAITAVVVLIAVYWK
jgi:hypothetical protein